MGSSSKNWTTLCTNSSEEGPAQTFSTCLNRHRPSTELFHTNPVCVNFCLRGLRNRFFERSAPARDTTAALRALRSRNPRRASAMSWTLSRCRSRSYSGSPALSQPPPLVTEFANPAGETDRKNRKERTTAAPGEVRAVMAASLRAGAICMGGSPPSISPVRRLSPDGSVDSPFNGRPGQPSCAAYNWRPTSLRITPTTTSGSSANANE